jgi:hypothetical protein
MATDAPGPVASAGSPPTIYYLLPVWQRVAYVFPLFGLVFGGAMAWTAISNYDPANLIFLLVGLGGAVWLLILGVLVYLGIRRVRLLVGPEGLVYYNLGYALQAPWSEVIGFGDAPAGTGTMHGLLLRQPTVELAPWLQAGQRLRPLLGLLSLVVPGMRLQVHAETIPLVIPVADFAADWQHGPLGDELRRYAPRVFTPSQPQS